jgi:hypothetical protein
MASCVSSSQLTVGYERVNNKWNKKYKSYEDAIFYFKINALDIVSNKISLSYCKYLFSYYELKIDLITKYARYQIQGKDSSIIALVSQRFRELKRNHKAFKNAFSHLHLGHSSLPIDAQITQIKEGHKSFKNAYFSLINDSYFHKYYDLKFKLKSLSNSLEAGDFRCEIVRKIRGNIKDLHRQLSLPNPLVPQQFLASSSSTESSSSLLNIADAPPVYWKHIAHIAAEWSVCAGSKYYALHEGQIPCHRTHNEAERDPGVLFLGSKSITRGISHQIGAPPEQRIPRGEVWDRVLICQDQTRTVQAIALYDAKSNKLGYLATNPDNIRHDINKDVVHRVQGAGTQIVLHLAAIALKTNNTLRLKAIGESIPFYQKLQFENDQQNLDGYEGHFGHCPMKLTVKKIRQLASDSIRPFDQLTELAASIPVCPPRKFDFAAISKLEQLETIFPPSSLNEDEKIALGIKAFERFGLPSIAYFEKVYRLNRYETSFIMDKVRTRDTKRDTLKVMSFLSEIPVFGISSYSPGFHGVETQARHYIGPIVPRKMISDECRWGANKFINYGKAYGELGKGVFVVTKFIMDAEKRGDNCLKYALLAYQAPLEEQFQVTVSMMPSVLDPLVFNDVVKRCFVSISPSSDILRSGDLAVYEHGMETVHAGIYREGMSEGTVESKWGFRGSDNVFQHSVFLVPDFYGNIVRFYRLAPSVTTSGHV